MRTKLNASKGTTAAARYLGSLIRSARQERGWTELELAERTGVSRITLRKIESGDLGVRFGAVLEAAHLVGVQPIAPLGDLPRLLESRLEVERLSPSRIRAARSEENDDDF